MSQRNGMARDGDLPDLRFVSVAEASDLTNLSRETIYQLCREGALQTKHIGIRGRVLKIRLASLQAWALDRPQPNVDHQVPVDLGRYRTRPGERRV